MPYFYHKPRSVTKFASWCDLCGHFAQCKQQPSSIPYLAGQDPAGVMFAEAAAAVVPPTTMPHPPHPLLQRPSYKRHKTPIKST